MCDPRLVGLHESTSSSSERADSDASAATSVRHHLHHHSSSSLSQSITNLSIDPRSRTIDFPDDIAPAIMPIHLLDLPTELLEHILVVLTVLCHTSA